MQLYDTSLNAIKAMNTENGSNETYPYFGFSTTGAYFVINSQSGYQQKPAQFWKETTLGELTYTTIIGEEHVHTPAEPVIENEVPATCTAAGSYDSVVYCSECGAELSRETVGIPALGHNWSAWISNNDGTHSRTCSVCSETETHDCEGSGIRDQGLGVRDQGIVTSDHAPLRGAAFRNVGAANFNPPAGRPQILNSPSSILNSAAGRRPGVRPPYGSAAQRDASVSLRDDSNPYSISKIWNIPP
ncbi:MAG: hypothetical protein IJK69_03615 [Oscillospiraceae bacterium]|nr:hypothetical protein [Oscillospiraceae bacterium]MBQ9373414.1 hypothetical protein [Oscillospiraceae bacterium]